MKVEIKVPAMGESITEAIISSIIKPSGSMVKADDEIIELETDKVNQVLFAPAAGQLTLNVSVDDKVAIGQVIGTVDTEAKGAMPEQPAAPAAPAAEPKKPAAAPQMPPLQPAAAAPGVPPAKAAQAEGPSARFMADEFAKGFTKEAPPGIAPQAPAAAGPGPAAAMPAAAPPLKGGNVSRKRMSNLRRVVASKLVEVKNTTAMLTTFNEVDMSKVMEIRAKEKENFTKRYGVRLGFMSFFVKASVAALKAFPDVNSYIEGDEIVTFLTHDIGVAVSTEKGLMVPVVRNCGELSFGQIEGQIEQFAKKARDGTISIDDLRGGSFTITNGGTFGSLLSTPILNPPQSAILGMHTIQKRAMVVNDQIVIRPMMYLALSYDHRIIDGKQAVQFLVHLKESLEDPARLLLDL